MAVQIVMLGLLALVGYFAGKTGYLPANSGITLSKIVVKLTAPLLILVTMVSKSFTRQEVENGLWIYFWGLAFLAVSFAISLFVTKRLKISRSAKNIYMMHSMFGNVVFLAFPLIGAVYGKTWLAYAVFFNLANDTVLWTLGIYLVNRHNTNDWRNNLKYLVNGNTIAFLLGIASIIINLQGIVNSSALVKGVYDILYGAFSPLGETTVPLSMLFIGLILSETRIGSFNDIINRYPSFILALFKLLLIPLIAFFLFSRLESFISPVVRGVVVLQLAMPCATIVPALAAQYESDYKFATENVFLTTLLSIVTLPLMAWIVK